MKRPSAVLDTNVVVSGLIVPKSKPGRLIAAWERNAAKQEQFPPPLKIVTVEEFLKHLETTSMN